MQFAREVFKLDGEVGIMSGFNKVGPVDVAFVTYPFRANPSYGLFLRTVAIRYLVEEAEQATFGRVRNVGASGVNRRRRPQI